MALISMPSLAGRLAQYKSSWDLSESLTHGRAKKLVADVRALLAIVYQVPLFYQTALSSAHYLHSSAAFHCPMPNCRLRCDMHPSRTTTAKLTMWPLADTISVILHNYSARAPDTD